MRSYPFVGQIKHMSTEPFLSNHLFLDVNGSASAAVPRSSWSCTRLCRPRRPSSAHRRSWTPHRGHRTSCSSSSRRTTPLSRCLGNSPSGTSTALSTRGSATGQTYHVWGARRTWASPLLCTFCSYVVLSLCSDCPNFLVTRHTALKTCIFQESKSKNYIFIPFRNQKITYLTIF